MYIILLPLLTYLGYVSLVYFFQEVLIFKPEKLTDDFMFDFKHEPEELFLEPEEGIHIHCLHFKIKKPKGCILYHHGNAYNLSFWAKHYSDFTKLGYDVMFYDYRGYGKSTGKVSKGCLIKDALNVHIYLLQFYDTSHIIQYGRSLGTGIAARLAYRVHSPKLILETPYFSMLAMAARKIPLFPHKLLLKFPLRTDFYIKQLQCPTYVFHGTKDELIPYEQSLKLLEQNNKIDFITIHGGRHMDLQSFTEYKEALMRILE